MIYVFAIACFGAGLLIGFEAGYRKYDRIVQEMYRQENKRKQEERK